MGHWPSSEIGFAHGVEALQPNDRRLDAFRVQDRFVHKRLSPPLMRMVASGQLILLQYDVLLLFKYLCGLALTLTRAEVASLLKAAVVPGSSDRPLRAMVSVGRFLRQFNMTHLATGLIPGMRSTRGVGTPWDVVYMGRLFDFLRVPASKVYRMAMCGGMLLTFAQSKLTIAHLQRRLCGFRFTRRFSFETDRADACAAAKGPYLAGNRVAWTFSEWRAQGTQLGVDLSWRIFSWVQLCIQEGEETLVPCPCDGCPQKFSMVSYQAGIPRVNYKSVQRHCDLYHFDLQPFDLQPPMSVPHPAASSSAASSSAHSPQQPAGPPASSPFHALALGPSPSPTADTPSSSSAHAFPPTPSVNVEPGAGEASERPKPPRNPVPSGTVEPVASTATGARARHGARWHRRARRRRLRGARARLCLRGNRA